MSKFYMKIERHFPAGRIIFSEDSECDGLYIIKKGRVRIFKTIDRPDGPSELEIVQLGPQSLFGEMALINTIPPNVFTGLYSIISLILYLPGFFFHTLQVHIIHFIIEPESEAHMNSNFRRRLREYRFLHGEMTQKQLGRILGMSNQAVCELERGKTTPSLRRARQLAKLLNTTIEELFFSEEDKRG